MTGSLFGVRDKKHRGSFQLDPNKEYFDSFHVNFSDHINYKRDPVQFFVGDYLQDSYIILFACQKLHTLFRGHHVERFVWVLVRDKLPSADVIELAMDTATRFAARIDIFIRTHRFQCNLPFW